MNYQLVRDFYLVKLDEVWENAKTKSGLITSGLAHANNKVKDQAVIEPLDEHGESRRRYGTVVEIPASFSGKSVDLIDAGLPAPRRYVGHDHIQHNALIGYRGFRAHENPASKYYPSTFEKYESVTMADVAKLVDVRVGDKVYFDHKATEVERYMGRYDDGHLFSVQVNEIICSVKESPIFEGNSKYKRAKIFAQGGWVLVKLSMEDWKDITTPNGIILKVAPEALPLQGRVVASQKKNLEGKDVLFDMNADSPITVEGMDLTCMHEDEILATIKPKIK